MITNSSNTSYHHGAEYQTLWRRGGVKMIALIHSYRVIAYMWQDDRLVRAETALTHLGGHEVSLTPPHCSALCLP